MAKRSRSRRSELPVNYVGALTLTPPDTRPLAVGVPAAFTGDPAPWIEPTPFTLAVTVVSFTLAAETEITLAAETALVVESAMAAETKITDLTALEGDPTVPCALLGEPTLALAGVSTALLTLFGEPTLTLELRHSDDVRTRDLFCCKKSTAEQIVSALFS